MLPGPVAQRAASMRRSASASHAAWWTAEGRAANSSGVMYSLRSATGRRRPALAAGIAGEPERRDVVALTARGFQQLRERHPESSGDPAHGGEGHPAPVLDPRQGREGHPRQGRPVPQRPPPTPGGRAASAPPNPGAIIPAAPSEASRPFSILDRVEIPSPDAAARSFSSQPRSARYSRTRRG